MLLAPTSWLRYPLYLVYALGGLVALMLALNIVVLPAQDLTFWRVVVAGDEPLALTCFRVTKIASALGFLLLLKFLGKPDPWLVPMVLWLSAVLLGDAALSWLP